MSLLVFIFIMCSHIQLSQNVEVMSEFVSTITDTGITITAPSNMTQSFKDDILNGIVTIGKLVVYETSEAVIDNFLHTVDEYTGNFDSSVMDVDILTSTIEKTCVASVNGAIPGSMVTNTVNNFVLSCAKVLQPKSAIIINVDVIGMSSSSINGTAIVSFTTWAAEYWSVNIFDLMANTTNTTQITTSYSDRRRELLEHHDRKRSNETTLQSSFLSDIHGVSIIEDDSKLTNIDTDETHQIVTIGLEYDLKLKFQINDSEPLRKTLSCSFFNPARNSWSKRGMIMRSMSSDGYAGCVSTHLTLFVINDGSSITEGVEATVKVLSNRVAQLRNIDLTDPNSEIHWPVPIAFTFVTLLLVIFVTVSKCRKTRVAVDEARLVFLQFGELRRPSVIHGQQFEAICRRYISVSDSMKLIILNCLVANPLCGMFVHWSHGTLVWTRADQMLIIYGMVIATFIAEAFLFDSVRFTIRYSHLSVL